MTPAEEAAQVKQWLPLVHNIVGRYVARYPWLNGHQDDLIQEGSIGLLRAARGYSNDRGASFMTYAYNGIRFALIQYLRSISRFRISKDQKNTKYVHVVSLGHGGKDSENFNDVLTEDINNLAADARSQLDNLITKDLADKLDEYLCEQFEQSGSAEHTRRNVENFWGSVTEENRAPVARRNGLTRQRSQQLYDKASKYAREFGEQVSREA